MTTHQAMTIRDYIQARLQSPLSRNELKPTVGLGRVPRAFKDLLRDKEANAGPETPKGLTAVDYRAAAITSRRSFSTRVETASFRVDPELPPDRQDKFDHAQESIVAQAETIAKPAAGASPPSDRKAPIIRTAQYTSDDHRSIDLSIAKAARKHKLPPRLIRAVIRAESNFQVDACSPAGAQGLMQLMPATARELGVDNPMDIHQNIDGGARYLRQMLDRYSGDLRMALAAYNAGPGNVDKYGGQVPFAETRQYVDRVLRFSRQTA